MWFSTKKKEAPEPEVKNLGDIVWYDPGNGRDRVPFVLTSISHGWDGDMIHFTSKAELDRTHLWG